MNSQHPAHAQGYYLLPIVSNLVGLGTMHNRHAVMHHT